MNRPPCSPSRPARRIVRPAGARGSAGFTMVELMVAVTIGLLILVAVTAIYVTSSAGKKTDARFSEFQTNGRYALDVLRRDIQHAGFNGITFNSSTITTSGTVTATNDCSTGFAASLSQPIYGADDTNPYSGSCIASTAYLRGDILITRRAGPAVFDTMLAAGTLSTTTLYLRSWFDQGIVFLGSTSPTPLRLPYWEDYPLDTKVYFIRSCTNSTCESPAIPALYRLVLGAGPAMTAELVASNIEHMQVQYGVTSSSGLRYYDAASSIDWPNVVSVRIWLLARSSTADPGYTNSQTISMGNASYDVNDGFQRQVFQQVIQVRK